MSISKLDVANAIDSVMVDGRDLEKYHTFPIKPTDLSAVKKLKQACNEKYKTFYDTLLKPRLDKDNKIKCDIASKLWIYFEDSKDVFSYIENMDKLPSYTDDSYQKQFDFWVKEFTTLEMHELYDKYSLNVISAAYGLILETCKRWSILQKYERIYSKSKDIDKILVLMDENMKLLDGSESLVNIGEIGKKACGVLASKK